MDDRAKVTVTCPQGTWEIAIQVKPNSSFDAASELNSAINVLFDALRNKGIGVRQIEITYHKTKEKENGS